MSTLSASIGALAVRALVLEASLAPKPGLVTPFSTGAHADMDYRTFLASASALGPCFSACAAAGETAAGRPFDRKALLSALRRIGRGGEEAMERATGGVNTHKGAIFCLGLLSAALGFVCAAPTRSPVGDAACAFVSRLCAGMVERELVSLKSGRAHSAGERLFLEHGARGARGQAEDGYPLLHRIILPILRDGRYRFRVARLEALVASMARLEDSCLLSRGGPEGLDFVRQRAAQILQAEASERAILLRDLDRDLCLRNLSPGGSADMVSAGVFLASAEEALAAVVVPSRMIA